MTTIPDKMKGVYLTGFGGFEKLAYHTDILYRPLRRVKS